MISVDRALEKILSYAHVLEPENKPLTESLGQVLAEDVYSNFDIPPLDNSAMDGYAVQAESTKGASKSSPKLVRVIGGAPAGYISKKKVSPGTAVRIMTGAPIPNGADAVVKFEDTDDEKFGASSEPLTKVGITRQVEVGHNIRRAGRDIAKGGLILKMGTVLRPQEIGVLASLGRANVSVIRRPLVAILATGDELVQLGEPLLSGKIYNSNTYSLAAQVSHYGGLPNVLGIARDNLGDLEAKINLEQHADLFLSSAGVSTGEYDMVKKVLARKGETIFLTVNMKPGKPLAFGVLKLRGRTIPHLGLPGNPVSSMVTFEQFARPAMLKMLGKTNFTKPTIQAVSEDQVNNKDGQRMYVSVRVRQHQGKYFARVAGFQNWGILTSMAQMDGLMVIPENMPQVAKGDIIKVQMLDWIQDLPNR